METKKDIDVTGFKKGLAAIMQKHHIAAIRSMDADEALFGFDPAFNPKRFCAYNLEFRGAFPGYILKEVVEQKRTYMVEFGEDLKGLFDYFEVQYLEPTADQNFFIGFDDGNSFILENISIEGVKQND